MWWRWAVAGRRSYLVGLFVTGGGGVFSGECRKTVRGVLSAVLTKRAIV